ncbi:MAG TPA: creatininase family protein [Acidobacteriota bacterium]|nr:creatininase family protein [Acidobacteriota bacterium]
MTQTILALALLITLTAPLSNPAHKGILLEDLTWQQAEKVLTPATVVVIPLGAAAKEHGPHLKLKNDWLIAEYLKLRIIEKSAVVVAPTLNYGFYPAFVEYPGSTSLRLETSRDMLVDVCRSLARFGPKRFYVLNTGISTLRALAPAAETLRADRIILRYTDLKITESVENRLKREAGGTHAEEIETSIMLYIAPKTVDMAKAVKDYHAENGSGGLTRDPNGRGVYSPTGVWGDATLATREKGKAVVDALVAAIVHEIEELARSPVPPGK